MIRILLSTRLGERKMTQAELSRMTQIRPSTINDLYWEMANRVKLEHLDLICEALQCDVSDLLVHEDGEPDDTRLHYKSGSAKPPKE